MTRDELLRACRKKLADAGVDNPALDARLLLLRALKIADVDLLRAPEAHVAEEDARACDALLARRIAGEPVARIEGEKEFYGLRFLVSPATLIPRPETEMLVDEALRLYPDAKAPFRVLDLGTGSGCILLSILHARPAATGVGIDLAIAAAQTARENARRLGLGGRAGFLVGDWAAAIRARFDLLVANPPYIPSADIAGLAAEVARHDPIAALDGGADGLGAYRTILAALPGLLAPGGTALFEIGHDQGPAVMTLARAAGLPSPAIRRDIAALDRMAVLRV